jgi:hypothetical protein
VTTVDISQSGLKITGLRAALALDEIIGIAYGARKSHFKVKWVDKDRAGLLNLNPQKPFWDFLLPSSETDSYLTRCNSDRRRWPRVNCSISVELRAPGQPVIWGKASDLSQGGCFIEIPIPLSLGTSFEIALWLGETKLPLQGQVAAVAPGFGNGIRFLNHSPAAQGLLAQYIDSIIPKQRQPAFALKRSGV